MNGTPATIIAVYQQPGANGLDVSKAVRETMEQMKASFPDGMDYLIALDTNDFVRLSIKEVIKTLFEAIVLVVLVVYLFLQSFRTTLICTVAIVRRADRDLHRHAGAGLLDQPADAVRPGARHRHGRRRRDRGRRERRAQHAPAPSRPEGGDDPLDGRDRELARRRRARDVLGVHSGRVPAGHHRPALQAVRDHDRDLGVGVGLHRADPHAGDVRGAAEAQPAADARASSRGSTGRSTA